MRLFYPLLLLLFCSNVFAQTLPVERSVDWTLAGLRDTTTNGFITIDMHERGVMGDGTTPNDTILQSVFADLSDDGAILIFPAGDFLFNQTIDVPDNTLIKGHGADATTFTIDLGGSGHSIRIQGSGSKSLTSSISAFASKDSSFVIAAQPAGFVAGDWVQIIQDDYDLVTSDWAEHTVGQIVRINAINGNRILLESPLRMDYDPDRLPYIQRIEPAKNVGIGCLKIHRLDNTAPEQSSNVYFARAVNCWVSNIESENCTFSHVKANQSSNLSISGSYFHHAFGYGGGGRAYGVMLQSTSNECLVEDNIFRHLRHSMILQSGANGNVFAYNYSLDPYWSTIPNDAAGDLVIHGNYTYGTCLNRTSVEILSLTIPMDRMARTTPFSETEPVGMAFSSAPTTRPLKTWSATKSRTPAFPTTWLTIPYRVADISFMEITIKEISTLRARMHCRTPLMPIPTGLHLSPRINGRASALQM